MIYTSLQEFINGRLENIKITSGFNSQLAQLVIIFGDKKILENSNIYDFIKPIYLNADIVITSTSGEIIETQFKESSIVVAALHFEKTRVKAISQCLLSQKIDSFEIGKQLFDSLNSNDLNGILVFSDGININGGELVQGLNFNNKTPIPITGGLAGDGSDFLYTLTGLNKNPIQGEIVAIGLYGNDIEIGHGSLGGWNEFGQERTITKAIKNVLFELDNKNALELYKEYLGTYSNELPASALLFPLSIISESEGQNLVRTILGIDEENKSMTFAGNMPEGSKVRLMKANFDKLIDASSLAAKFALSNCYNPQFALLISCVGRKLVLQERTEEEIEAAKEILGNDCSTIGFYSYGEISPLENTIKCELHNQTMTVTTLSER